MMTILTTLDQKVRAWQERTVLKQFEGIEEFVKNQAIFDNMGSTQDNSTTNKNTSSGNSAAKSWPIREKMQSNKSRKS